MQEPLMKNLVGEMVTIDESGSSGPRCHPQLPAPTVSRLAYAWHNHQQGLTAENHLAKLEIITFLWGKPSEEMAQPGDSWPVLVLKVGDHRWP